MEGSGFSLLHKPCLVVEDEKESESRRRREKVVDPGMPEALQVPEAARLGVVYPWSLLFTYSFLVSTLPPVLQSCQSLAMSLLDSHIEQIALSSNAIADLPSVSPSGRIDIRSC